jgi:hypothetical protein
MKHRANIGKDIHDRDRVSRGTGKLLLEGINDVRRDVFALVEKPAGRIAQAKRAVAVAVAVSHLEEMLE